jgi:hypothetical protein
MRGVSTLVGVVLLLVVALIALSVSVAALRGAIIWPKTVPRTYLCFSDFHVENGYTKLTVWHQGGEVLKTSDVLVIIEGTLEEGGKIRVEDALSAWCSENMLRVGKYVLTVPYVFQQLERLTIIHRPTNTTVFYMSSPVNIG